MYLIYTEQQK